MKILPFILSTLALSLLGSTSATAVGFGLKPGLWEVSTKMKRGDKEFDPQAEMKRHFEKMSPDQRKKMEAMMGKSGMGRSEAGMKICHTKESLEQGKALGHRPDSKCDTQIVNQTSSKMVMDFKCKDGAKGTGEWNLKSDTNYDGRMMMTSKDGVASEIIQSGKFLSADCGTVKPFSLAQ